MTEQVQLAVIAALVTVSLAAIAVLSRRRALADDESRRDILSVDAGRIPEMHFIHFNDCWHHVSEFRRWTLSKDGKTLTGILACDTSERSALRLDAHGPKGVAILAWLSQVSQELGRKPPPPPDPV